LDLIPGFRNLPSRVGAKLVGHHAGL
jgi:hypothetical protein